MSIVNEKMKCGCVALLALLLTAVRFDLPGNPAHAQENGTPSSVDGHRSADTTANSIWLDGHVLWSYGTGNVGYGDGELAGPHSAEENPFRPDEILVSEQYGCDVLVINRQTRKMRVLYGERGKPGSGKRLDAAVAAHYMPSGPYKGHVLITECRGGHRTMIVDRDDGHVLWSCNALEAPLDAIYWDDDHIMVSDENPGVFKIRLRDKAKVWHYDSKPHGNPFYLQKIDSPKASYGGDLLVGFWGQNSVVREIRTSDKATVWIYGDRKE